MSSIPEVRDVLLEAQRELARDGAVAVGRDCGTVVFPHAQLKLYLDASEDGACAAPSLAAARQRCWSRHALMHDEVGARDRLDATRSAAPMRPAADAHVLDTGVLGVEEVVQTALELWAASSPAA